MVFPRVRPRSWPALRSRTWQLEDPGDLLDLLPDADLVWLAGTAGIVGRGLAARISLPAGPGRLYDAAAGVEHVLRRIDAHPVPAGARWGHDLSGAGSGTGAVAVGALPFSAESPAELVIPAVLVQRTPDGATRATCVAPAGSLPDRPPLGRSAAGAMNGARPVAPPAGPAGGRAAWRAAVRTAIEEIDAGRLDKVVLARELRLETPAGPDRETVLRRLWRDVPGAFVFGIGDFVGASPELLVARAGREARSVPMAGTVRRGAGPVAEAERIDRLRASAKEGAEHRVVVEAVAAGLKEVAEAVEVAPTEVALLPTVAHLATPVRARLGADAPSALGLAGLLHPTPAVAGTPTDAALALIETLEPFPRGPYAGPVGWVHGSGDGQWAVAIRCGWLEPGGARLYAGAGIVAGSDPDAEWDELEAKFDAMRAVLRAG